MYQGCVRLGWMIYARWTMERSATSDLAPEGLNEYESSLYDTP